MGKIANNLIELMGNTPLVRIQRIAKGKYNIIAKLEFYNPCGSIKDRIGVGMVLDAEKKGLIKKNTTIIEPTSGNTGIALAWVCAVRGYPLIITMPDTMSVERRTLLKAFGIRLELTAGHLGMHGAIDRAKEINKEIPNSIILQQFENPANPDIHRKTTAQEIWRDTKGKVDIVVTGVGTGGTITGIGEFLKKKNSKIKIVAVEPTGSAVLSGEEPGPHMIQGIGAGFIPNILNRGCIDRIEKVTNEEAIAMTRRLAKEEGIFAGISSGAALVSALKIAEEKGNQKKQIVVLFADTGERYLSTILFAEE